MNQRLIARPGQDTPWAVLCENHGIVCLTEAEYMTQLSRPDATWRCPICSSEAEWDDQWHEERMEELEEELAEAERLRQERDGEYAPTTRYVEYVADMEAEGFKPGWYILEDNPSTGTYGLIVAGPHTTEALANAMRVTEEA